jgi:hypothetical protein
MGGFLNNHCPVVDKHFTDQSSHQFRTISRYKKEMTATVFTDKIYSIFFSTHE